MSQPNRKPRELATPLVNLTQVTPDTYLRDTHVTHTQETPDTYLLQESHVTHAQDTYVTQMSDTFVLQDTYLTCDSHAGKLLLDTHVTDTRVTPDTYLLQDTHFTRDTHVAQLLQDTHVIHTQSPDTRAPPILRDTQVTPDTYQDINVTRDSHVAQLLRDTYLSRDACVSHTRDSQVTYEAYVSHLRDTRVTHDTRVTNDTRVTRDVRTIRDINTIRARANDVTIPLESNEQKATFITIIKKGANFVLSANFAFWLVRTLFVPILHIRYLVRKWNV